MKRKLALALLRREGSTPARPEIDLSPLRGRLPQATERDAVVVDFLEDDLREAREALGAVAGYLGDVESALGEGRAGRDDLLALALGRGPIERIEYLAGVVGNLRRRLVQLSSRVG